MPMVITYEVYARRICGCHFLQSGFKCQTEDSGILGILGFYLHNIMTILCLKTIWNPYIENIEMCESENQESSYNYKNQKNWKRDNLG